MKKDDRDDLGIDDRKKDYSGQEKVKKQLVKIYQAVEAGFKDKQDQIDDIDDAWDIYNCVLNGNQSYEGKSKIYVPLVRDAIEARVTRYSNQIFPQNGRFADVIGQGETPYDVIAMLDYYVGVSKLRSVVIPALLREGDCSGQYSLYIDWSNRKRHVVRKVQRPVVTSELGNAPPEDEKFDDIVTEEVEDARPDVVVLDARDLLVLPASVDEIEDAEIVAIAIRMTEKRVKKLIRDGVFEKEAGEALIDNFGMNTGATNPDTEKKASAKAGVQMDSSGNKRATIYKVWSEIKVGEERRLFEMYFAGENLCLSCKRIPVWNDRVPVISAPALKVPGSFFGKSRMSAVAKIQYQANDAVNIGMDSASYALLPIVMTDPEKTPKIGSMVLAMAAIWETNPNDTKFVEFPPLYKEALGIVSVCKDQIMQSMSVNPAMMPHAAGGKKPTQAEVAQAQQVALESTADVVNIMEETILSRLLEWFYDLDYQYRTKELTIQKFGEMGLQADMQSIPLSQDGSHYIFKWNGTQANKSVQQVQQMIAATNVLRGIPPQQMGGRKLDLGPVVEHVAGVAFGPRMAPKVLIDKRHEMGLPAELENRLMLNSFPVHINPMDNDMEHIQMHQQGLAMGDPNGLFKQHISEHMIQMRGKAMEASGIQPVPPGQPGQPGPGTPRQGAQPGMPRPQQPPGAVSPDQMPLAMPRKAGI